MIGFDKEGFKKPLAAISLVVTGTIWWFLSIYVLFGAIGSGDFYYKVFQLPAGLLVYCIVGAFLFGLQCVVTVSYLASSTTPCENKS
ncbi:hypothetical protein [Vibrio sp. HN007]|uniref:hypothetical protein n=1 Tax=Vibrio iocasae TaxID=3098914 RepID=UPI0035D40728